MRDWPLARRSESNDTERSSVVYGQEGFRTNKRVMLAKQHGSAGKPLEYENACKEITTRWM